MLCENALALGCEQSNVFLLNISVYHNNRSNQVANKDRYYCTTKRTLLLWFWVPFELNNNLLKSSHRRSNSIFPDFLTINKSKSVNNMKSVSNMATDTSVLLTVDSDSVEKTDSSDLNSGPASLTTQRSLSLSVQNDNNLQVVRIKFKSTDLIRSNYWLETNATKYDTLSMWACIQVMDLDPDQIMNHGSWTRSWTHKST